MDQRRLVAEKEALEKAHQALMERHTALTDQCVCKNSIYYKGLMNKFEINFSENNKYINIYLSIYLSIYQ